MVNLNQYMGKKDGISTLSAAEWNGAMSAIQTAINSIEGGGSSTGIPVDSSAYLTKSAKGNLQLEVPSDWKDAVTGKGGKLNLEAPNDIQFKSGDDIIFYSHKRDTDKQDEITMKFMKTLSDNTDVPVNLQINAANLVLTTKDKDLTKFGKSKAESDIFDIKVTTGLNSQSGGKTRGYLKVRARAIDLRCEEHGGIALQPKGQDSSLFENKIKFEHGGGDGLEFGTFNSEKTSIFTDEYRFNKDGKWYQTTRTKVDSDKYDSNDPTTKYKYQKNPKDDFYDFIDETDPYTTTKHLIKTAYALNTAPGMKTEISGAGNCKISGTTYYTLEACGDTQSISDIQTIDLSKGKNYEKSDLKEKGIDSYITSGGRVQLSGEGDTQFIVVSHTAPKVSVSSDNEVGIEAKVGDVTINSGDCIKMEGPEIRLNAINSDKTGALVNFGSTFELQFLTKKFTKSGNVEAAERKKTGSDDMEQGPKVVLGIENNSTKEVYLDTVTGMFHRVADELFWDQEHQQPYTAAGHSKGKPIYDKDGKQVMDEDTFFVLVENTSTNGYDVYKVGTKEGGVTGKSASKIASFNDNSDSAYTRENKSDGTPANPKLIVHKPEWSYTDWKSQNNSQEDHTFTAIKPKEVYKDESLSVTVEDIVTLVSWMKNQKEGPWKS